MNTIIVCLINRACLRMSMEPVDKSRNFLPIPYENIRIDWTGDYFQITDDDGAVYKFAGGRETGEGNSNPIGWKHRLLLRPIKETLFHLYMIIGK